MEKQTTSIDTISKTCIAVRLRLLNRVVTNFYDDALRPLGLKVSQLNILIVTARLGLARPVQVCDILQLDTSTLSRNLERMRAHGWLEVVPGEDARTQSFRLTTQGKRLIEKAIPAWEDAQRQAGELLGDQGIALLDKAAKKLRADQLKPCVFFWANSCIYNNRSGHETRRPPDRAALSRKRQQSVSPTDCSRCCVAASTVPRLRGRRRWLGGDQSPGAGRPAGGHSPFLSAHQDPPQLRLPDEPGADPQPGPLGRQPRIPPHRRSRQRGRPQGRVGTGGKGSAGGQPSDGLPDGDGSFSGRKIWVVSHKPVAVAAGLGHMGIHRNVIHPKFGNFILLGTVLIAAEATAYDQPISYNPCLECKLCVAACPVGAISPNGDFNFSACYTHNYREFMGGFTDWVEQIADSKNALDYRKKVADTESASMWQSLSFGANYKAAYCLSVCPAGEEVIGPFLTNKAEYRPGHRSSVAGESGDDLRRSRFGRRGSRCPPLPAQNDQTGWQWSAAPDDPRFLDGAASHISAGEGCEFEGRLPLHLHRQRRKAGNRHDP